MFYDRTVDLLGVLGDTLVSLYGGGRPCPKVSLGISCHVRSVMDEAMRLSFLENPYFHPYMQKNAILALAGSYMDSDVLRKWLSSDDLTEMPEKTALVNKIAKERNLIPFRVNSKSENIMAPLSERIQLPVEQWLRGFYDAEFVVTDSFHACVFSILFNKPFIVYGNAARGLSRFTSLLETFELNDRLFSDWIGIQSLYNINWSKVNITLDAKRKEANDFLNNL